MDGTNRVLPQTVLCETDIILATGNLMRRIGAHWVEAPAELVMMWAMDERKHPYRPVLKLRVVGPKEHVVPIGDGFASLSACEKAIAAGDSDFMGVSLPKLCRIVAIHKGVAQTMERIDQQTRGTDEPLAP